MLIMSQNMLILHMQLTKGSGGGKIKKTIKSSLGDTVRKTEMPNGTDEKRKEYYEEEKLMEKNS